jgi:N-acetylglucosamine malate deacetylase 1
MILNKNKRILVLAPHTDDAEFGCGATMAKFSEEKHEIFCIAFSTAEESFPADLPKDINKTGMLKSMESLGIQRSNVHILNYPVRHFPEHRQAILEELVKFNNDIDPEIVFLPSTFDTHQDHQVVSHEGFRAFKRSSILGYELPWNNITFTTNCFIQINENHLEKKQNSLEFYISQFNRSYINKDFIESWAKTRGGQIGLNYAEAFEIIRFIMI